MHPRIIILALAVAACSSDGTSSTDGSATSNETVTAYYQSGGTVTRTGMAYGSSTADESGVKVVSAGTFTLSDSTVTTSGDTSSGDDSSFYGLNAGVLATTASTIKLSDSTVTTTGTGANGVFATGAGTSIALANVTIQCSGQLGHGVDATVGASLSLADVAITTAGANGAAIATDRGGGTITVTGGTMKTSGADSPGIYSTGAITVSGAALAASGSEAAVIEGENSITLTNTSLSGAKKRGVMIYQSMSGDASGSQGTFTMTGGSLSAAVGPLFYVTNTTGVIALHGVELTATSGALIDASAGNWGTSGANGGTAKLTADDVALVGSVIADSISAISVSLTSGSSLTGSIDNAALSLDATSSWSVGADSTLTSLRDASGISGTTITNIFGNGHTVTYDPSLAESSALGGATYSLSGGGTLAPR